MQLDNTRIYQRALELIDFVKQILSKLPTGYGFLQDQLRRASSSVVLNFAEGYAKPSLKEQRRFFAIARGSASEVCAIFDVAHRFGLISNDEHRYAKDLSDHIVRMLVIFRTPETRVFEER